MSKFDSSSFYFRFFKFGTYHLGTAYGERLGRDGSWAITVCYNYYRRSGGRKGVVSSERRVYRSEQFVLLSKVDDGHFRDPWCILNVHDIIMNAFLHVLNMTLQCS